MVIRVQIQNLCSFLPNRLIREFREIRVRKKNIVSVETYRRRCDMNASYFRTNSMNPLVVSWNNRNFAYNVE